MSNARRTREDGCVLIGRRLAVVVVSQVKFSRSRVEADVIAINERLRCARQRDKKTLRLL